MVGLIVALPARQATSLLLLSATVVGTASGPLENHTVSIRQSTTTMVIKRALLKVSLFSSIFHSFPVQKYNFCIDQETTVKPVAKTTPEPTTMTFEPSTQESSGDLSDFPPRRSEKIKKKKEKEVATECKRFDWYGLANVTCSNGVKNGSKCQMVEGSCKDRYVTTVLTCLCQDKKNQQKCKWTVGPKDRPLNSKGPKCVRGNKKG